MVSYFPKVNSWTLFVWSSPSTCYTSMFHLCFNLISSLCKSGLKKLINMPLRLASSASDVYINLPTSTPTKRPLNAPNCTLSSPNDASLSSSTSGLLHKYSYNRFSKWLIVSLLCVFHQFFTFTFTLSPPFLFSSGINF